MYNNQERETRDGRKTAIAFALPASFWGLLHLLLRTGPNNSMPMWAMRMVVVLWIGVILITVDILVNPNEK